MAAHIGGTSGRTGCRRASGRRKPEESTSSRHDSSDSDLSPSRRRAITTLLHRKDLHNSPVINHAVCPTAREFSCNRNFLLTRNKVTWEMAFL